MNDIRPHPALIGGCACGAVRYRVDGVAVATYACHCTDCQRLTGSAFGETVVVRRAELRVVAGTPAAYAFELPGGRARHGRLCLHCATRLWGESPLRPLTVNLRAGTLDDRSWFVPALHLWVRSRQRWVQIPEDVPRFETQPDDPAVFARAWTQHLART